MRTGIIQSMFKHHHIKRLNTQEKLCIAALISWSFMKGVCVGMYLSKK